MKAQLLGSNDQKRGGGVGRSFSAVANEERKFVAAAKNGDSVAFGILCTQSAGMVFNVARRIMPTNEDAEDVMQESFQLAFSHLKNFKGDSRFSTWLTRIVINAALMRLRKNNVRRESPFDESPESQQHLSRFDVQDQSLNPEQLFAQKERHWMLCKAVKELTGGMRRAIELRELDERSTEETARIMGISVSSVKARIFHGRRKLRRLLKSMNSVPMYRDEPRRLSCKPEQHARPTSRLRYGRLEKQTEEPEITLIGTSRRHPVIARARTVLAQPSRGNSGQQHLARRNGVRVKGGIRNYCFGQFQEGRELKRFGGGLEWRRLRTSDGGPGECYV